MGTPDFAVPALTALIAAGHDIAAVYSQPPRPAGRGQKERLSPVHALAAARGVTVETPKSLRNPEAQARFASFRADIAVVAAYGLILPKPVLDAPRFGCLNIHGSLLPRWRGAAPIQRAIMAGDRETGICIMQMDEGLDTGGVLARDSVPIGPKATAGALHETLAALGAAMIVPAVDGRASGAMTAVPQPAHGTTYATKIDKAETRIDWSRPALELDRHIRALSPFPGAWTQLGSERIKILAVEIVPDRTGPPGETLDDALLVGCGTWALRATLIQREGKRPMTADEALRGKAVPRGTGLG